MKELIEIQSRINLGTYHVGVRLPQIPAVYMIENPVGQVYIGGTKNALQRYRQYVSNSFKGQRKLNDSFKLHGKNNHTFSVIEYCSISDLRSRERYWSMKYDAIAKGLNLIITGDAKSKAITSDDAKRRMGERHKGKKLSESHKNALLNSVKGKKQAVEHIEKRKMFGARNPMYGKRGYWKGKKRPPETVEKLRLQMSGKGELSENPNARKVIDISTGEVFGSAKEVSIKLRMNYSTLKAMLQGVNKNKTNYRYYE